MKRKEVNVIISETDNNSIDLQNQRAEWRRKSWSIPDLRGSKKAWFSLVKELITLVKDGRANDLDTRPTLSKISNSHTWRSYATFLKGTGLVKNNAGSLVLSETGDKFYNNPTTRQLADILQDQIRLFGEVLKILDLIPSTIEVVDEQLSRDFGLSWNNLSRTRRRMDWLEVLDLIEDIGNRKWGLTAMGRDALKKWCLVSPDALDSLDTDCSDVEITEPPAEIAVLLQSLSDSPDKHLKRNTYNIWVPAPNRINNLRIIIQVASERITKAELFSFIEGEFNLKASSVESMLPFLKASGLLEEVKRGVYSSTIVARAWLETGNDIDFIRILHANMRFVGEMIEASKNEIVRNDLYSKAKLHGLNTEKARWIAGFLIEAGLLEETQYLHIKATPSGMGLASSLPLASISSEELEKPKDLETETVQLDKQIETIIERLIRSSCDPVADGFASGVAFEEAIADAFRFMGFDSERIGGSGDTDVVLRWQEDNGTTITAIVDGKSKSSGKVSHSDISDVAIDTHKDKNGADFVGIIGSCFSGETIRNHARKKAYSLISVDQLCEIARASETIGLRPQEIGLAFKVPDGLSQLDELIATKKRELEISSTVISRVNKEQNILGGLSPRDLFFVTRDTSLSPSLEELLNVFETLSKPEIGVLFISEENPNPEHTTYVLGDAKSAANRFRALAAIIDEALDK